MFAPMPTTLTPSSSPILLPYSRALPTLPRIASLSPVCRRCCTVPARRSSASTSTAKGFATKLVHPSSTCCRSSKLPRPNRPATTLLLRAPATSSLIWTWITNILTMISPTLLRCKPRTTSSLSCAKISLMIFAPCPQLSSIVRCIVKASFFSTRMYACPLVMSSLTQEPLVHLTSPNNTSMITALILIRLCSLSVVASA
mmetsp:Transcript_41151/g.71220  ORF Transcript_41151/g.71220 Transcript_41151/m.71220 type:complete len:200 (-) Transcript_41151:2590-3189(-)